MPPKPKNNLSGMKPYSMTVSPDGAKGEIRLYGDVVENHPTDWWTGKPEPGMFIAVDKFLKDMDELDGCSEITVRISSGGGELYAGIEIYHKLIGHSAKIITINEGLAASAASVIFMAGDERLVYAGTNTMIHLAASFVYGYYQRTDLEKVQKRLEAHDNAAINIYAERTGIDKSTIEQMMRDETWMTGEDAVDKGFATDTISAEESSGDGVIMRLSPDKTRLFVNGRAVAACLRKPPADIPQMTAAEYAAVATTETAPAAVQGGNNTDGGNPKMYKTVEELRAAQPELVAQIETAAVNSERQRIQGIDEIEGVINDANLVQNAKYGDKPMSAGELLMVCAKSHAKAGTQMFNDMKKDTADSGAPEVTANAAPPAGKPDDPNAIAAAAAADVANFYKQSDKEVF